MAAVNNAHDATIANVMVVNGGTGTMFPDEVVAALAQAAAPANVPTAFPNEFSVVLIAGHPFTRWFAGDSGFWISEAARSITSSVLHQLIYQCVSAADGVLPLTIGTTSLRPEYLRRVLLDVYTLPAAGITTASGAVACLRARARVTTDIYTIDVADVYVVPLRSAPAAPLAAGAPVLAAEQAFTQECCFEHCVTGGGDLSGAAVIVAVFPSRFDATARCSGTIPWNSLASVYNNVEFLAHMSGSEKMTLMFERMQAARLPDQLHPAFIDGVGSYFQCYSDGLRFNTSTSEVRASIMKKRGDAFIRSLPNMGRILRDTPTNTYWLDLVALVDKLAQMDAATPTAFHVADAKLGEYAHAVVETATTVNNLRAVLDAVLARRERGAGGGGGGGGDGGGGYSGSGTTVVVGARFYDDPLVTERAEHSPKFIVLANELKSLTPGVAQLLAAAKSGVGAMVAFVNSSGKVKPPGAKSPAWLTISAAKGAAMEYNVQACYLGTDGAANLSGFVLPHNQRYGVDNIADTTKPFFDLPMLGAALASYGFNGEDVTPVGIFESTSAASDAGVLLTTILTNHGFGGGKPAAQASAADGDEPYDASASGYFDRCAAILRKTPPSKMAAVVKNLYTTYSMSVAYFRTSVAIFILSGAGEPPTWGQEDSEADVLLEQTEVGLKGFHQLGSVAGALTTSSPAVQFTMPPTIMPPTHALLPPTLPPHLQLPVAGGALAGAAPPPALAPASAAAFSPAQLGQLQLLMAQQQQPAAKKQKSYVQGARTAHVEQSSNGKYIRLEHQFFDRVALDIELTRLGVALGRDKCYGYLLSLRRSHNGRAEFAAADATAAQLTAPSVNWFSGKKVMAFKLPARPADF